MNNLFFGLLLLSSATTAVAQDDPNFSIRGTFPETAPPEVYLTYFDKGMRTDSARVVDHRYAFTGHVPQGEVVSLTTAEPGAMPSMDNIVSVFLSPGEDFSITHSTTFSHLVIKGSPANDEYQKLLAREKTWQQEEVRRTGAASGQKNAGEKEEVYGDYIRANPSSPLLLFAFTEYVGDSRSVKAADVPRLQAVFSLLPASYRESAAGKSFQGMLDNLVTFNEKTAIGKPAPDFTQNDTAGHPVTLSSYRGKYVLLDFWASWCGPCREENPTVVAAYAKYHSKGFEILGVSLDQKEGSWKKAIRDDKLNWTHVSDLKNWDNAVVKLYGVQGVPQNFLIDPQGKIIARGLRGEDLDKKLAEIYKN